MSLSAKVTATSAVLLAALQPAAALEWAPEAGVGMEYSDNLTRSAGAEEGSWAGISWVGLSAYEDSAPLQISAEGELQYESYFDSAQEDELLFFFDGQARYSLIPGRLSWVAEDYFEQVRIQPLRTITPANRQGANLFMTGPDLEYELTPVDQLILGARYGNVYFEESPADNHRLLGSGSYEHAFSSALQASANYQVLAVDYQDEAVTSVLVADDFTRTDVFGQVTYERSIWSAQLEAGTTDIDRSTLADADGRLLGVTLLRELPQDTQVGFRFRQQFTEAGASLRTDALLSSLFTLTSASVVQDLLYEERWDLFIDGNYDFFYGNATLYHVEEDYELVNLDNEADGFAGEIGYAVSLAARGSVFGRYEEQTYGLLGQEDSTYEVGLRARRRLGRHWEVGAAVSHTDRDSTVNEFDFSESRALVYLRFGAARPIDPDRERRPDFGRF